MVKHTQTTRRQQPRNCLSVFDHFVGLVLKGLMLLDLCTSCLLPALANDTSCEYCDSFCLSDL